MPYSSTMNKEKRRGEKGMPGIMQPVCSAVMTIVMYPVIAVLTIVAIIFFPLSFIFLKAITGWDSGRITRAFIWIYGRCWIGAMSPFVRFKREGFKNIKLERPCIIVVNHLSFFDTYCMGLMPFSDITFALRSWPFKMFWYKPFMQLAGYLDLEKLGWEKTLEMSKSLFAKGGSFLCFPEGHRSKDGEIQRFYSGPFKLAVETGVPILPLCLTGTDVLMPPGRLWFLPATIRLRALPLVHPEIFSGDLAHADLRKYIKKMIEQNVEDMRTQ